MMIELKIVFRPQFELQDELQKNVLLSESRGYFCQPGISPEL
jgi:hypothetical protein